MNIDSIINKEINNLYNNDQNPYLNYSEIGDPICCMTDKRNNKKKIIYINDGTVEKKNKKFSIEKNNCIFEQIPNIKKKLEIIYISGPSGSGKTYYAKKYAKKYKNIYPNNNIFLFSKLLTDKSIDDIAKIKRIILNQEILNNKIMPEDLKDSLVIFDDIGSIRDPKIKKEVYDIVHDCITIGRHYNIKIIITTHLLTNYKETRSVINECDYVVIFPKSGNYKQIKYFLENYIGCDKYQINKILNLPSRWICIRKIYPTCILHEKGIYLLNKFIV